jgi:hypothetical protein
MLKSPTNAHSTSQLFGLAVQRSLNGTVIPIVYGRRRLAGNSVWVANWAANPITSGGKMGGKAGGSGKSGSNQQYDYTCSLLIGLCQGPIGGIVNVWNDKDQYQLFRVTHTYTVSAGSSPPYTYTTPESGYNPHGNSWYLDNGVSRADTTTITADDSGSPGPRTFTVTHQTPMQLVPILGGVPNIRQDNFVADGVNLTFALSQPASSITGVQLTDQFSTVTYPTFGTSGAVDFTYTVGSTILTQTGAVPAAGDTSELLVTYATGGGSASPGLGQYTLNVDSGGAHYLFSAADGANSAVMTIDYMVMTSNFSTTGDPLVHLDLVLFPGTLGQAPWNFLVSNFPGPQAVGYSELACVGSALFDLGSAGMLPNLNFEVVGFVPFGGSIVDCCAADVIKDLLTSPLYGPLGWDAADLPSDSATCGLGPSGELYTYCAANGLFVSPLLDSAQTAAQFIQDVMEVQNGNCFWSEGLLKFRSYGDTSAIGNGSTFTPNTQPQYDLDDDDFLCAPGEVPIKLTRPSVRDAYNQVTVEWCNRSNQYNAEPVTEEDACHVGLYGARPASPVSQHMICGQATGAAVARTLVQRKCYIEGGCTYEFKLSAAIYPLLEPMDIVTITDPYLGCVKKPVRIVSIEEDDQLALTVKCEEFPWSVSAPTLHGKQVTGAMGPGYYADPGSVNPPVFFEAVAGMASIPLYTLLMGLSGGPHWGGATIHMSADGASYSMVGRQTGPAVMGVLTASLAANADPDSTGTLAVDLTMSLGTLESYSQTQADQDVSLILVDQELMAYRTATPVSACAYSLTYLRRGVFGTRIQAHAAGALFCKVDPAMFEAPYQWSDVGQVRYFKFTSFNSAGMMEQDVSLVAAYEHFITGPRAPFPWSPGYVAPLAGDAVYPKGASGKGTFGLQPVYGIDGSGAPTVGVSIKGIPPITLTSQLLQPPVISCTVGTAGALAAGVYEVAVAAFDTATPYRNTDFSNIVSVVIPSGGTGSIAVTITWPTGANGGDVYLASPSGSVGGWHQNQGVASGVTSAVITAFAENTPGGPDSVADHLAVQWFKEVHGGPWAQQVQGVTGVTSNTVTIAGAGMTTDQWANRTATLLAKYDPSLELPVLNLPVAHSSLTDTGTGMFTLTIGANSAGHTLPDLTTLLAVGDLLVMRNYATFTATSFTDSEIANPYFPGGDTGIEAGYLVMVLTGADAGDVQVVKDVTGSPQTTVNLAGQWAITPATGDLVIVVEASTEPAKLSKSMMIPNNALSMQVAVPDLPNESGQVWVFQVKVEDANGNSASISSAPMREMYLFHSQGTSLTVS